MRAGYPAGPTRRQAAGPRWRRTSPGLYVPAEVDAAVLDQRVLEAAASLPPYGGVTGWAALHWCGARWRTSGAGPHGDRVPLAVAGLDVRARPVAVSHERLRPDELVAVDGLRVTTPARAVLFEARHASTLARAVTVVDMACWADLVSIAELWRVAEEHATFTGVPQARDALALARENAWSPAEVELRLLAELDAGLPPLLCNAPVFDLRGRHLGTPDLMEPVSGLAVDYDGVVHLTAEVRARDLRRGRSLEAAGLQRAVVVAEDVRDRARTAARPPDVRRWTLEPPTGWVSTATVEQRRALDEQQASRLLRYRAAA